MRVLLSLVRQQGKSKEQSATKITCNYADNYYGDQVCTEMTKRNLAVRQSDHFSHR